MASHLTSTSQPVVDGRHARRERGRLAVTNATIDLVFEGHAPPTADQIAERAGVSVATLFRYFETVDDLRERATEQYFERYSHVFEIPGIGVGTRHRRIASFVAARVAQHETTGPVARLMRTRAPQIFEFDATLHRLRSTQADQIRLHFAEELTALTPAIRDDVVAVVATITSFESWDQVRHDHERSAAQTRRAWNRAIDAIFDTL